MSSGMPWSLEVVCVPVSDIDRAKAFYAGQLSFEVDHDTQVSAGVRFVQLTSPGSGCSIVLGTLSPGGRRDVADMAPGTLKGLQMVVPDIDRARAELVGRGVDVTPIAAVGRDGPRPRQEDDDLDNVGFCWFSDPDGNGWAVQQSRARALDPSSS